jgi:MoaA/NifB/PqqE/SkfB family radical SAM enzyme
MPDLAQAEVNQINQANGLITSLPIVVLHVHSQCNCRCVMCDIWKTKNSSELLPQVISGLLQSFRELEVKWVVLTGGEPLLHSDLSTICVPLRQQGTRITVLTTGLLLGEYAQSASALFDEVIISLDGPGEIHDRIRRVKDGFQVVHDGVRQVQVSSPSIPIRARTTVQKLNFHSLRATVAAAREMQLDSISFLASDLTATAFNRPLVWPLARQEQVGLSAEDVAGLEEEIEAMIRDNADDISSGFIAESAAKLRTIVRHFRAHLGLEEPVAPICNAPWVSTVVELDGSVRPCFFHQSVGMIVDRTLQSAINSAEALDFRASLDVAENPICRRCVCSLNYQVT